MWDCMAPRFWCCFVYVVSWGRCVGYGAVYVCKRVPPFRQAHACHLPPRGTAFLLLLLCSRWDRWRGCRQSIYESEAPLSVPLGHLSPKGNGFWVVLFECLAYNRHKESTHSIVDASVLVNVPKDIAYSGCRQSRQGNGFWVVLFECLAYNRHKESTHSIVDASVLVNVPKDIAYSGCRQSRLFYFYLSFFVRKVSNAIIDVLRSNNTFITSKKIEIISKSVICVTSLPVGWEAATPCRGYFLGLF